MQAIIRYQSYLIEPASYTFWKHFFKDFENIILIKRNFMKVILVMNRFYNYCDNGDLFLKIFYKKAQLLFGNSFLWNLKISPWKKLYEGNIRIDFVLLLLWSTPRTWHLLNYLMHFLIFIVSVLSPTWIPFVKPCCCVFLTNYP